MIYEPPKLTCPMCGHPFAGHTKRMSDLTGNPDDERIVCSDTSFGPEDLVKLADEQLATAAATISFTIDTKDTP